MWSFERQGPFVFVTNPTGERWQFVVNKKFALNTDTFEFKVKP